MAMMLSNKQTRNAHSLCNPSNHVARGVPGQDALMRTPLWLIMIKAFLSRNGFQDPKQEDKSVSGPLGQCPQVLICPPPLPGHHRTVNSLLDRSKVIIRPMNDGDGERKFELGLIVTMSFHPWDSNAKVVSFSSLTHFSSLNHTDSFSLLIDQNPPDPQQQESPVPHMPCEQTLWQSTPGLSGTQWSEDLFREPSQPDEPPIPGPSKVSDSHLPSHKSNSTHDPEPEVAPTH
ncbi:hypothetical protein O181_003033 [Austropuccinia psidii MF-1]|uniref:Uncharacterized protein n=1 Tax=Austropuccinia psidii MF-1 TaxID=1389203 RepID=A0A9Q3BDV7_9BASI|nr:hypothetical protein [Austropuccinia psidii MF-1]